MTPLTFGKMQHDGPGNDSWMSIFRDGTEIGVIESSYTDVGATSIVYRVCEYRVIWWACSGLDGSADGSFDVDPKEGNARTILANAKAYARETATPTEVP